MTFRIAAMVLLYLAIASLASSQGTVGPVVGKLSVNRIRIRESESLEIRFVAINRGREPIELSTLGRPGDTCGRFRVTISHNGIKVQIPPVLPAGNIIVSCLGGGQDVAPGHQYIESIWIGHDHEFSQPGKYHIYVTCHFAYDRRGVLAHEGSPHERLESQFEVTVEEPAK